MQIEKIQTGQRGSYLARPGDTGPFGDLTFHVSDDVMVLEHTSVPPDYAGQGVGVALVARAVADARASGQTIIPDCPFAAAQFCKRPDWADVLHQGPRP